MDPLNPSDQPRPEPDRRAKRKGSKEPPKTSPPSSRYKRPGAGRPGSPASAAAGGVEQVPLRAAPQSDAATDRLNAFAHEVAALLDGAIRWVTLSRAGVEGTGLASDPGACAEVSRRLDAATTALERISHLIHGAMRPCAGANAGAEAGTRTLRDAFEHAVDVLRPLADARGVRLESDLAESLGSAPAGAMHSVALCGLRNAIEASGPGGFASVRATVAPTSGGGSELHAEIIDEGVGPPPGAEERAFEHGYSTKPGAMGVGLTLSREILREMGGTMELRTRMEGARRRGASLVFRCPLPPASPRAA